MTVHTVYREGLYTVATAAAAHVLRHGDGVAALVGRTRNNAMSREPQGGEGEIDMPRDRICVGMEPYQA